MYTDFTKKNVFEQLTLAVACSAPSHHGSREVLISECDVTWRRVKARVYNPGQLGELSRELARFESGTSSKFHPHLPIPSVLCPKPLPHKLERASSNGTQQGEGDAGARRSNSAEFSVESQAPK